jgi:hypothetical protein
MNTLPDESTLARWLDDELQGAELAAFDASVRGATDLLARRQQVRAWRAALAAALPATIEPPYPEFFNSRIARAIRAQTAPPRRLARAAAWRTWWMPASAAAGMALAFWVGTKAGGVTRVVTVTNPAPVPVATHVPTVYTPERGVDAEWFSSSDAAATVIVLEGVEAIPDTLDFAESACLPGIGKPIAAVEPRAAGEVPQ